MAQGIGYDERLIRSLETSLQSAFHQPYLRLTRRSNRNSPPFQVQLTDEGKIVQADDGLQHRAMEVLSAGGQSTSFYFAFLADFEFEGITRSHVLQHSSLMVFHEICEGELTSFFRAEWDEKVALDPKSEHAQPHWHFVQSPARIESIVRNAIGAENMFVPPQESELFGGPNCGRFHFTMAPLWNATQTPSYKQTFDADGFGNWFSELTRYIAGQIAYVLKHSPARKDFAGTNI